ncbi:MAG: TonB-dependent receptor [Acidobacteriota bacterium]
MKSFACCAIFVALALPARAQVLYGSIVGNVTDSSEAAVPGASVTITHLETGQKRTAATSAAGAYSFPTIPSGTYDVQVAMQGFQPATRKGLQVTINSVVRADIRLQLGAVTESIVVTGTAAALQTDRAEVRAEMVTRTLRDLPVPLGRNYQQLFRTLPGFSPPANSQSIANNPSRALAFNVNGASSNTNNVRIEGASATHVWASTISVYVPALESIEAVNIVSNSFDAEQGLAGGAAVNVQLKSGTNELHGSGFLYHNDNHTKARPFFFPAGERNPKMVYNQFGATAGGPIKRDKLFYFVSWEGTKDRENAARLATVPTDAIRRGDMSGSDRPIYDPQTGDINGRGRTPLPGGMVPASRMEPIALKIRDQIPLPTFPNLLTSNYYATAAFAFDRHTVDSKINWNATDRLTMNGRFSLLGYNMNNQPYFGDLGGPPINGGAPGIGSGNTYGLTLAGTYVFNPNFIVDANFGYTMFKTSVEQPLLDRKIGQELGIPGTNGPRRFEGGWPRFEVTNYTAVGIHTTWMPFSRRDPQYQYVANANWIKGSHNVRFGMDLYRQHMNHLQVEFYGQFQGAAGGFSFGGGPTALNGGPSPNQYNSFAAFLLGLASSSGRTLQVPDEYNTRQWMHTFYLRDQWQASRKLTLSYGVRWEYFPMGTRADRGVEQYDFNRNLMRICGVGVVPRDCGVELSKRLFVPRIGLAWRASDTLVVRAGYGISNDPHSLAKPHRTNYPVVLAMNVSAANSFQPSGRLRDGIPAIKPPEIGNGIVELPPDVAVNSVGDRFVRGYIQSWNFTLEKQLTPGLIAQAGYVATRQTKQMAYLDLNVGLPGGGRDSQPYYPKYRRAVRTALVTPVGNSQYDSLQVSLRRSFSAGYQFQAAYTWSKTLGLAGMTDIGDTPSIPRPEYFQLNRARTGLDRPHNLQLTGIAELPFGRGKRWANGGGIAAALLGGWQLNGVLSSFSGNPFSVSSSATSLNAPGNSQRADLVKPVVKKLGGVGPGEAFYDWTAFAPVTEPRFGTAGFNILRGPGQVNLDAGLFRQFRITERVNLQFRAEGINATNTPHFSNPSSNISNLRLGPDGSFRGGVFEVTSVNPIGRDGIDERVFRVGVRVSF